MSLLTLLGRLSVRPSLSCWPANQQGRRSAVAAAAAAISGKR